jgi:hypothetical protein
VPLSPEIPKITTSNALQPVTSYWLMSDHRTPGSAPHSTVPVQAPSLAEVHEDPTVLSRLPVTVLLCLRRAVTEPRALSHCGEARKLWWAGTGLNRRHQDFQT